jgi:hypothetical protein
MEHLNNESADARISEWRRPAWAADRARQYILRRSSATARTAARPARRSSPAAGLSLDRTGNGRPSQTRDLVKRWGRPRGRPLPETEILASQARRRKGRQVFHRITHEHQRLQFPPRGRAPYRSESCRFGKGASLPLRPSSAGAASQEKTHMKNMTANAATASVIATAATIRRSSSIGGLPAAMSVRRIQS